MAARTWLDKIMRDFDPRKQRMIELAAKPMANAINSCLVPFQQSGAGVGFALFMYTSDGPEMVYVSNTTDRAYMIAMLKKFVADNETPDGEPIYPSMPKVN